MENSTVSFSVLGIAENRQKMSFRIPGLHTSVLVTLCLCVCVYQGLTSIETSQLVHPIPRHRLWEKTQSGELDQLKCIEVRIIYGKLFLKKSNQGNLLYIISLLKGSKDILKKISVLTTNGKKKKKEREKNPKEFWEIHISSNANFVK